jgi:hypothetical protein
MEAEPNDAYEHCEETEPRHEQAAVSLRTLEREVIGDNRADLRCRHA